MKGRNIRFEGVFGKLSLNYPFYPFLSGALYLSLAAIHFSILSSIVCPSVTSEQDRGFLLYFSMNYRD